MWGLGFEPGTSVRAASALNHGTISPALGNFTLHFIFLLVQEYHYHHNKNKNRQVIFIFPEP